MFGHPQSKSPTSLLGSFWPENPTLLDSALTFELVFRRKKLEDAVPKAHIMYKANLSQRELEKYLPFLKCLFVYGDPFRLFREQQANYREYD